MITVNYKEIQTSLENKYLRICDCFVNIPPCLHSTLSVSNVTTGLACVPLN